MVANYYCAEQWLIFCRCVVVATFMGTEHIEDSGGETTSKLIIALIVIAVITALILEFLAFRLRKRAPG